MPSLTALSGREQEIRAVLADHLPWSPHDGVPGVCIPGDRSHHAKHLTRSLVKGDDLRFICQLDNDEELVLIGERLPWDSNFFGYEVARLNAVLPLEPPLFRPFANYADALRCFTQEARERGIRYLLAPADVHDLPLIRALGETGFALIETRPVYHRCVRDYVHSERYPCRLAGPADVESLAQAARDTVNLYDRFHADPFIDPEFAGRLLYRWVEAAILERFADAVMVPDVANPTAFATIDYHQDHWQPLRSRIAQIRLVVSSPQTKGWATKIFSEIHHHLKDQGFDYVTCTTQLPNRGMLRLFEKLGYSLGKTELLFRIVL